MGKPGAKKMDQIVSVTPGDVHIIMVPSPGGPVPTPIPHPCSSIIKDNVATKVKVMGQPGAVKGSKSKHTPPHIPMGPGPFQKPPKNEGEIITGSANVFYEGKEAAMLGDTGQMCSDPSDTPVGKVIGTAGTVLVGGGGSDGGQEGSGDGKGKKAGGAGSAGLGDVTATGHPVDVATGNVIVSGDDFSLDGPLPIQFVRTYVSARATTPGPVGFGWTHNFQESMELVLEGDSEWQRIHNELTEAGNPAPDRTYVIYRDPNGLATSYRLPRDGEELIDEFHRRRFRRDGNVFSVTNWSGIVSRFARITGHSNRLQLIEVVDRNGNKNQFRYSPDQLLTEVEDCYGRTLLIVYKEGHITEIRLRVSGQEPEQRWCSYKYSDKGDLIEVIDRAGFSTRFAYVEHLIIQDENRDGYSFFFAYDERRRCIRTWGQDGHLTRYLSYDTEKRRTREINGEGELTIYSYTPAGLVWRKETGVDLVNEFTFDAAGRVVAQVNGGKTALTYDYDEGGRVIIQADGEGNTTAFDYNSFGQVTKTVDPVGSESGYEYDDRGNMVVRREADLTRYEHDERGRIIREIKADGTSTTTTYDRFGHISQVAGRGGVTHYEWDPLGNLLKESPPGVPARTIEWNAQGFPTRIMLGTKTVNVFEYTPQGYVAVATGADGTRQQTRYWGLGIPIEVADYQMTDHGPSVLRSRLSIQVDTEGRPAKVVDQDGHVHRFGYDSAGRLCREEAPDGPALEYCYNGSHLVREIREPGRQGTSFEHDGRGLPVRITYPDGAEEHFEHDPLGRLLSATNSWGTASWEYDNNGQPSVRRQGDFEVRAVADEANGTSAWLGSDRVLSCLVSDPRNRRTKVVFGEQEIELLFDESGRLQRTVFPNRVVENLEYYDDLRLARAMVEREGTTLDDFTLTYDEQERVTETKDRLRGTRRFSYDALGRLHGVNGATPERYQYDDHDNLTSSPQFSGAEIIKPDRLVRAGPRRYTCDRLGRVVSLTDPQRGHLRFQYNGKGDLITVAMEGGQSVHYTYDALRRRVEKRFEGGATDGQVIRFYWNDDQLVKEEKWERGEKRSERSYLFLGDKPIASTEVADEKSETIFYHDDQIGTPRFCTDGEGQIVWQSKWDSFGYDPGDQGGFQNIRFPGQYYDEETGLCYNRYRYFDPFTARYLQPDPLGALSDLNQFNYPRDPLSFIDPLGLTQTAGDTLVLVADPRDSVIRTGSARLSKAWGPSTNLFSLFGPDLSKVNKLVINAHGSPDCIEVRTFWGRLFGKKTMTGAQLAEYLKKKGFRGNLVVMASCDVGSPDATFAGDLAQGLGSGPGGNPNIKVAAWAGPIGVHPDGMPRMMGRILPRPTFEDKPWYSRWWHRSRYKEQGDMLTNPNIGLGYYDASGKREGSPIDFESFKQLTGAERRQIFPPST